jgi:LysR family hca operon transcriptional activator
MELRHLRYFVAVAEEGSFTSAAEKRLYTAQPSLSRQIRELEMEVGVRLLERKARGIVLTAAGRVFLDHARLALMQVDAAAEAARLAERPAAKSVFTVGFLIGQEIAWLPETLRVLREETPDTEVVIVSQSSPELASALMRGKMDVAFLRREKTTAGIDFKLLAREPLVAIVPARHRLAKCRTIRPQELERETYINPATMAPVLKAVIDEYVQRVCIQLKTEYHAENLSAAMSLVASTGGVTLFPRYVQNMLTRAVVTRPLSGEPPTIELVMGYSSANASPLLRRFLARTEELIENVAKQQKVRG